MFDNIDDLHYELEAFFKDTERKEIEKLRGACIPFINAWSSSPKTSNTKKLSNLLRDYEIYLRARAHQYNLLMPKLSDTSKSMLG